MRWAMVGLGLLVAAPAAFAASECTETAEYTEAGMDGNGVQVTSRPSKICGAHFFATSATGWCQVYDSPDGTSTHGQSRTVAEPGAASANDADHALFPGGYDTRFGLGVDVDDGRCIVHYRP